MKFARKFLAVAWRVVAAFAWWGFGLWTVLAAFYTFPGPNWLRYLVAAGFAGLFLAASRERFRFFQAHKVTWREKRFSTVALAASAAFAIYYVGFVSPDPNQEWASDHARQPHVTIDGDKVHIQDVRNFKWRSRTDYTPGFYDRTYDLNKIDTMYYVVASMPSFEPVAHVFVCFGFTDGQTVAVSVEGRRAKGRPYQVIPSLFRQFQMIYVIGDERDVLGKRGAVWKIPVFFYPANTTKERIRAIFVDMMERAHSLEEHPEFYHLIFNNCMNNITYHLRRLGGRPLPHDLQMLMTGLSDRVAHRLGYIDTDLPFAAAREAFRVDPWMQQATLDEGFGQRLRETVRRQEAEARAKLKQGTAAE